MTPLPKLKAVLIRTGARTHLVSSAMAAAVAVTGRLTDVRELLD